MKDTASGLHKNDCAKDVKIVYGPGPTLPTDALVVSDIVQWQPLYDFYLTDTELIITFELAGVQLNDLTVYANKLYIIIDGIRRRKKLLERQCCTFHNIEISYGRFFRKVDFPVPVKVRKCRCVINNGLFTIAFPIVQEKVIPIEDG